MIVSDHKCCGGCIHWKPGSEWHTGKKYAIECKGTCHVKKNSRKRWNYISAFNCRFYESKLIGEFFIIDGQYITAQLLRWSIKKDKDEQNT